MKKIKFIFTFIALFAAIGLIVGCQTTAQAEDSYVTLDINPSVELIVSPKDKVIFANPLNEDAEILLVELDLIGMDLDGAIDLIIHTSIELGYISVDEDVETFVFVATINADAKIQERVQNRAKEQVNKAFENRGVLGKANDKSYRKEFVNDAQSYGVTPGFLFLAMQAVELSDELLLEDALLMTRTEVLDIVKQKRQEARDVAFELREQFHNQRDKVLDTYLPQIQELEAQIETTLEAIEAIVELIDHPTDDTDVADLESQKAELESMLEALNESLESIKAAFHDALEEVRNQFHEQSQILRAAFIEAKQQRRNEHQEQIQQFLNDMEQRRDQMRDRIRNYQEDEDGNTPDE